MNAESDPILLIDAGNSYLKYGWLEQGGIRDIGRLGETRARRSWQLPAGARQPRRILLACVAGATVEAQLAEWCRSRFAPEPEFLRSPASGRGISNAYREPARLGIDRWAAMLAARELAAGALCVVDAGTALTLDFLLADGRHLGGYIVPGLASLPACLGSTTSLVVAEPERSVGSGRQPGKSSVECIGQGALQMSCAMLESALEKMAQQYAEPFACIISGGDAAQLAAALDIPCRVEPDLVLQGLGLMAQETG